MVKAEPALRLLLLFLFLFSISCTRDFSTHIVDDPYDDIEDIFFPDGESVLDINGDDVTDFGFEYTYQQTFDTPSSVATKILSMNPMGNFLLYSAYQGYLVLSKGDSIMATIDSNQRWSSFSADIAYLRWHRDTGWDAFWSGEWAGVSNGYLPVALNLDDGVHYGWIEMSCDNVTGRLTIHNYDVNDKVDKFILAGIKK